MLCEKCGKNEAAIHYSEIINGKKTSYSLCQQCAEEMGVGNIGFGAGSLLSGFFGDMLPSTLPGKMQPSSGERRCPVCSASLREIAKTGKVGCAECYRTFRAELAPTIRRIHGSAVYKGKTPDGAEDAAEPAPVPEADALRAELYEAIKSEDFERAAVLRDKIKSLGN